MAHTLTITVNDTVYEVLKPFIEQQTIDAFLNRVITKDASLPKKQFHDITSLRGSLHQVDISDIREENDRVI